MHNLLQFWDVIGSIATFTLPILVFGPLRLLSGDRSFWVSVTVNIKVDSIKLDAHHPELDVSLYWTFVGDPSLILVRGSPTTANIKRTM
jgi:hypothetical protein